MIKTKSSSDKKQAPKPLKPYTRRSDDTAFNIRRKSTIYRTKIKNMVEMYNTYAGVVGKLDPVRKASIHFMADTMTFDSDRRMARGE